MAPYVDEVLGNILNTHLSSVVLGETKLCVEILCRHHARLESNILFISVELFDVVCRLSDAQECLTWSIFIDVCVIHAFGDF